MLLGIRFVNNADWKKELIQHYTKWKTEKELVLQKKYEDMAVSFGQLLGLSEQDMRRELELSQPFKRSVPDFSRVVSLLNEEGCRHYFVTGPVVQLCQKIKVKEPFDIGWLEALKDGKKQLNFGDNFIRYQKTGNQINALAGSLERTGQTEYFQYTFFSFDVTKKIAGRKDIIDDYDNGVAHKKSHSDYDDDARKLFFQMVTFLELASVQEVLVKPGAKHGHKKDDDNLFNKEKFPITIVNSNWNKIIRTEGFEVEGHLRKQPYGPSRQFRKLIWIDDFHKNGYNLNAGKIADQNPKGMKR